MVSDVESGKRIPSPQILTMLAEKYQVDMNWFLLGIGKKNL
jgi:transcriptional regulator with XRE-family HTH domain